MKENIRQRAHELGFDDCRFTTADAPDHAVEFEKWIAQKHHGEMGYLERNAHKRVNPQKVLPGARSVVVLAASYAEARCVLRVRVRSQYRFLRFCRSFVCFGPVGLCWPLQTAKR